MKFGLEVPVIENIISVLEQYPKVDKAFVFGSRAKGNYRPDSDIDLAIKGYEITTDDIIAISVDIETIGVTYKFDLIDYNSIKESALKEHIDRVGVEFYSRWKKYKMGEVVKVSQGLAINKQSKHLLKKEGFPLLRITDMFSDTYAQFIDPINAPKQCIAEPNEIIYTRTGQVGYVFKGKSGVVHNNCFKVKPNDNLNKDFIYWFLKQSSIRELANNIASGSVQLDLPHASFNSIDIILPPLSEQTAIASILSSLDDKIDLLHRQNKTLEQLAETLFRQWFVEEAEENWEVGTVFDLFKLQRGFDLPSQNRIEGKYPIVASSGISETHNEWKVKAPGVTTGRSGSLGNVFYIEEDFWPLNTSLFVSEFKRATPLFSYFFLKTLDLNSLNGGSAVPTLNRNNVHELKTELPPHELIQDFEGIVKTYFQKIKSNQTQIHTLTHTRDTLLPKLMSGEVRVEI